MLYIYTERVLCTFPILCVFIFHRLSDGSLLLSLDGSSHSTYMREEVGKLVTNCLASITLCSEGHFIMLTNQL